MYNYITQINLNHKVLYTIKWCIGNIGLRKYFFAAILRQLRQYTC